MGGSRKSFAPEKTQAEADATAAATAKAEADKRAEEDRLARESAAISAGLRGRRALLSSAGEVGFTTLGGGGSGSLASGR